MTKRNGQNGETLELSATAALQRWSQSPVVSLRRFPTGNQHYVFDASLEDGTLAVVRMALAEERPAMAGAVHWNGVLRPLRIRLPEIFFSDLESEFPFLILERLPGEDLGLVVDRLGEEEKRSIAAEVIAMQRVAALLPSAGRFGYAVSPEQAPHATWADCLRASLARSRGRIRTAGLVSTHWADQVSRLLEKMAPQWAAIPARAFLHDLTTKNVIVSEGRLSGIVDVDDLCWGDPLFQIALTKMALLSQGSRPTYIDYLLDSFGPHSANHLDFYTALCCLDFLSELGEPFNGNPLDSSAARKSRLESLLHQLCY
jgi:Ser/Thr protein kinase RdoA (MazF antagonist)